MFVDFVSVLIVGQRLNEQLNIEVEDLQIMVSIFYSLAQI